MEAISAQIKALNLDAWLAWVEPHAEMIGLAIAGLAMGLILYFSQGECNKRSSHSERSEAK